MTKPTASALIKGSYQGKDAWMVQVWSPIIPDGQTTPVGAVGININLAPIEQLTKDAAPAKVFF
jgi:hypothetical protein